MKMYKRIKKGFTLVELVVVIAVIAILAAVSVLSYTAITKKARQSKDQQIITEVNGAMKRSEILKGKPSTVHEALGEAGEGGFNMQNIETSTKGYEYAYVMSANRFVVLENNKIVYPEEGFTNVSDTDIWTFAEGAGDLSSKFSNYLKGTDPIEKVEVSTGFDPGERIVNNIEYKNSDGEQSVVIRTNSFGTTLTIKGPLDTVKHYGNAAIVNVEEIASASYHENGTVGRLTVEKGHAVAESEAVIFCFNNSGASESTPSTVDVKTGATVYNNAGEAAGIDAVNTSAETLKDDCGAGHHHFGSQLVIDDHVYEVCKSCGYTLVTVVDLAGNESKTTMIDNEGEIVNTPIETYNDTATNAAGQVIESKEEPIVETPTVTPSKETACLHEFVSTVSVEADCTHTGVRTFSCSKCGMSYTSNIPMKAHTYYDQDHNHDGTGYGSEETCLVCGHLRGEYVAEVNGVQYATLTAAINAVPTDGTQTLIKLVNDDAIEGNAGWTIAANQNVVLDLNGYSLKNLVTADAASQVIKNQGTLVIKDSSDLNKDGSGSGVIFNQAKEGANIGTWPTYNYVTNIITNTGDFTLQSGYLYLAKGSSISYCIDTQTNGNLYEPKVTINGGKLYNFFTNAIRMFANSTSKANVMEINGGDISGYGSIWVQGPNKSANKFELTINGGTFNTTEKAVVNGTKDLCLGSISTIACQVYTTQSSGSSNYSADSFVKITGGTFNENISMKKYGGSYALEGGNLPSLEITGGTFNGYVYANGDSASVKGGSFKFFDYNNGTTTLSDMNEANMIASGYHTSSVSNGYFRVVSD